MEPKPKKNKRYASGSMLRPKQINRNKDCPWLGCKETFKTIKERDRHSTQKCKFRPDISSAT